MRFLFLLDPLEKLNPKWDTSLYLVKELQRRGHTIESADIPDLYLQNSHLFVQSRSLRASLVGNHPNVVRDRSILFSQGPRKLRRVDAFDLLVIRKEPPFDLSYLYLTQLLTPLTSKIPMSNHPLGIQHANEKLSILNFKKWIPKTLVTSSAENILNFMTKLKQSIVVKPLDSKGGKGVQLLRYQKNFQKVFAPLLRKATEKGRRHVMAQEFLSGRKIRGDKRIILLNGEFLTAYEKRFAPHDFRSNLDLGGTFHATRLTVKEKSLIRDLRPYLLKEGLSFVGLDVMAEKLIEINVTCPAGIPEAEILYPDEKLVKKWADYLESLIRFKKSSAASILF